VATEDLSPLASAKSPIAVWEDLARLGE
jgi:hypothetical protein